MVVRRLAAVLLILSACSGELKERSASPASFIVIAAPADPDILFPPLSKTVEGRQATELIYDYLADVGPAMNTIGDAGFVKQIASGWTWGSDSMSITFDINPAARWHDGKPVTANDILYTFSVYTDSVLASPSASSLRDIDSVSVVSPGRATIWFNKKTPHQFYDAAAQMLILPAHALDSIPRAALRTRAAALSPIGSGRYTFSSWKKGTSFELRAVQNHFRGKAIADRVIFAITPDYQAAVASLAGGVADVFAGVRAESIDQLTRDGKFKIVSLPGMDYVFMQLNLKNPIFASRELRRALTMTLDRQAMVQNVFDTLALESIGPTVRAYPTTDASIDPIPYDTAAAARLLDSLGWKRDADGMRKRNGKALRFTAIVPSSSTPRRGMSLLIQEQLRRAGIEMRVALMAWEAFSERYAKGNFEAALANWHLPSSTESVKGAWTTKGETNYGGYSNSVFDALVDSALTAKDVRSAKGYFLRANQTIVDDAPAVWLYEPRTLIAVSRRLDPTPMRPSAWWLDIGSWKVEAK